MRLFLTAVLGVMTMLGGCKSLEPEPVPNLPVEIPHTYSNRPDTAGQDKSPVMIRQWWHRMDSPELDRLIEKGFSGNHNLKILKSRIKQAKASLKKEASGLRPRVDYSLGADKSRTRTQNSLSQGGNYFGDHSWDASLSGSYTVDVWGETSAGIRAQTLGLEASVEDLNDAALGLAADIAQTWVDIISVRNQRRILGNQIQLNQTQMDLLKLRFLNGRASALDVSQQRESLARVLSLAPILEREESLLLNSLGFMFGGEATTSLMVHSSDLPKFDFMAGAGIPANLLENRPDIRAARKRLFSSLSQVEAAKADLLPSFTLTAKALFSSGRLELLFHNWVASLGAALAGPLLDGGTKEAEVERTRAVVEERLALYARTVAEAVREVEDGLVSMDRQKQYLVRLEDELAAARLTLADARVQYLNGQSSYLNLLTVQTAIDGLERQMVSERALLVKQGILLQKRLGWNPVDSQKAEGL